MKPKGPSFLEWTVAWDYGLGHRAQPSVLGFGQSGSPPRVYANIPILGASQQGPKTKANIENWYITDIEKIIQDNEGI